MATFRARVEDLAHWPYIAVFLVLFLLLNAGLFAQMSERIMEASGGVDAIDLLTSYTPDEVFPMVEAYGDLRTEIAIFQLTADVVYPIVYSMFFSLLITLIFKHAFPATSRLQALNLVPFAMAIIDLLENIGIVIMLLSYPVQPVAIALASSVFTTTKWLLFVISLLSVVIGTLVFLYRRVANKPLPA